MHAVRAESRFSEDVGRQLAGTQRAWRAGSVIPSTQVQEFVAETWERHTSMTTRRKRRYQRGSVCKSNNGQIWYGRYYPVPGAPQRRVRLGRTDEIDERQARIALDDLVAELNRNPGHVLGTEPVRRFIEQVYVSMK